MVAEPGGHPQSLVFSRLGQHCSTQTSVALVSHKPAPPLSPLPLLVLFHSKSPSPSLAPVSVFSLSCCYAVPWCPLPLLQSYPSSPVLPTLWFPVAACLLTFLASSSHLPFPCILVTPLPSAPESHPCTAVCLLRGLLPPGRLSQPESSRDTESAALMPHVAWHALVVDGNPGVFGCWHQQCTAEQMSSLKGVSKQTPEAAFPFYVCLSWWQTNLQHLSLKHEEWQNCS